MGWKPSDERLRGNAQSIWNANDVDLYDKRSMRNSWKPIVQSDRYVSSTLIFVSGYCNVKHGHWLLSVRLRDMRKKVMNAS